MSLVKQTQKQADISITPHKFQKERLRTYLYIYKKKTMSLFGALYKYEGVNCKLVYCFFNVLKLSLNVSLGPFYVLSNFK